MQNRFPAQTFGQRVRLRACGVLIENGSILLVKHEGLGHAGFLWNPPGGGVEFGESVQQTIEREFLEETGLIVVVGEFLAFSEHIGDGLHAVELFFKVSKQAGDLSLGSDPELEPDGQMMTDIRFWNFDEIRQRPPFWFHKKIPQFMEGI